ncbi:MAG TPA: class I SAM-dependent methyltransferase [Gammaproteobacteria bacterium]|nr:class I SAM-dependent methyltransferase [Gammaproteobacteria bacterium]
MRFPFGQNWRSFLSHVGEKRVAVAEDALRQSLGRTSLSGWRALDIGSGSGLSSLAMRRLGAHVVSFDYDRDSVACTEELRRRYDGGDRNWEVLEGSALDAQFMSALGTFDLVYAWGVLHHTGAMWRSIELAQQRVAAGGVLLIALYNDQGWRSRVWYHIKRLYCSHALGRALVCAIFYPLFALYAIGVDLVHLRAPGSHMREYGRTRGMSITHDWRDWLGGYPFEVARPEEIRARLGASGFSVVREQLTRGWGCNELVLAKSGPP